MQNGKPKPVYVQSFNKLIKNAKTPKLRTKIYTSDTRRATTGNLQTLV